MPSATCADINICVRISIIVVEDASMNRLNDRISRDLKILAVDIRQKTLCRNSPDSALE